MQAANAYDNEPKLSLALIIGGIAVFGLALGLSRGFPAGGPVPFGLPVRFVHQLGVVAISAGFCGGSARKTATSASRCCGALKSSSPQPVRLS